MAEKAPNAVIQAAYIQGVLTRSVNDLVKAMGLTGISRHSALGPNAPAGKLSRAGIFV